MPGLVPGIHVLLLAPLRRRGWPGQARPWRNRGVVAHGSLADPNC